MVISPLIRRVLLAILLVFLAAGGSAADLSVLATFSSGDYGNETESDIQQTWLRFATGDRYQFRIATSYLQVETTDLLVQPRFGAVPVQRGKMQGQGNSSGNAATDPVSPPILPVTTSADGLGDVWVSGFVRLLGGGAKVYRMDSGVEVKAPTADEEQLLGTGEWDYRFALSGEYYFWTASTFGAVGWNRLGDPDWVELNDVLDLLVGAESEPLWDKLILSGWVEGNQEIVEGTGSRAALGLGLRSTGRFRWRLMATAGLGGSAEKFSFAFGLSMGVEPPKTGLGGLGL